MSTTKTAVVLGAGPGLGMSIAHRFGREGYRVALVSRSDTRHGAYLTSLAEAGIEAAAFTADLSDKERLDTVLDEILARFGTIDLAYYGPAAMDGPMPGLIAEAGSADVRAAMELVYPAVDAVGKVLPGMIERGSGGFLFAGGLSSVVPMPTLGALAVMTAALRNYAITLNAGLSTTGVYAGALTIGGLIERGDIHKAMSSDPNMFGDTKIATLDPDGIADTAWDLFSKRDRAEAVFNALG
ncbi:SDR family NAD(P)-dependent oxidoreductase [Glycomyces rhizosphaerae]|uniref:SDR family NAD(P)-dependent oxidoreductase n=1 Tax=Glycomyces rhizosphaerae TaxID=2054422 RepID=A0ABV7PVI3_9ACTN